MKFSDMKWKRLTAGALTFGLLLTVCTGCRSSSGQGSELSSLEEDSNWADLMATASPEAEPSPSTSTYLPELAGDGDALGEDVTASYQTAFLGTWVDEQSVDYEFRSSGVLVLTTEATGATENWSYSFRMQGNLPLLVMTKDGSEKRYSFTLTSKNLTLYDPDTGNAQALLSKVTEEPQATAAVQTEVPTATPEVSAAQTETVQAAATPEPEQTAQPEEQPEQQEQEPAQNPEDTQQETAEEPALEDVLTTENEIEDAALPVQYQDADQVLENVMGAVMDMGLSFNKDSQKSFWGILAYYFCASGKAELNGDNYFAVSEQEVEAAAKDIFADYSQAPEPDGYYCSTHEDGNYMLLFGAADARELVWYKVDASYVIQVGGENAYTVTVNDSGAVVSVTQFTADQAG